MVNRPTRGKGKSYLWLAAHTGHHGEACLAWPFARDHLGRGQLGYRGETYKAHRLMCILVHGPQPTPAHEVGHSCGKGHEGCVNPDHLRWITRSENGRERRQHGTAATNHAGWKGKLTKSQIAEIRALKASKVPVLTIARRFGISTRTVDYWTNGLRERRGCADFDGNVYKRHREKVAAAASRSRCS